MDTIAITERQIAEQIEGRETFEITFTDAKPTYLELYDQSGGLWIRPAFSRAKKISAELAADILSKVVDHREFNTDYRTIESNMKYDDFYNQYFNCLPLSAAA